ncbi:uncharacterized protein [Chiloscyllium punctatum]|uniref:uncharacterized protein isoform X4 n=1 Tax=Chiloscyllium punctatum TaxID=137246 RepID=UPI003B634912
MAASRLSVLVFLLPALLYAGQGVVDIKTPALPVNGTVGHFAWLPVEMDPIPEEAEITWKFREISRTATIARLDTSDGKIKIFKDTGFEGRVKVHTNLTLQINDLRLDDGGIYTVTVTGGGRDYTGTVTLQIYGSRPVEGLSTSLYTVFPIIIIIIIIAIICVKVQKARCRNPEERTLPDQSFQQVPTIPNNYDGNTGLEQPCTVYAVVQRTNRVETQEGN